MSKLPSALAFCAAMATGIYLCMHDFPRLGGWTIILSLLGTWGFEKAGKP